MHRLLCLLPNSSLDPFTSSVRPSTNHRISNLTSLNQQQSQQPSPNIATLTSTDFSHLQPTSHTITSLIMTRTEKHNDRNHAGLADGTATHEDHLPRYFAKSGHVDVDPKKVKKEGGGKGNWGVAGEESQDYGYTFVNQRRRSNSSSKVLGDFKTKFEALDQDPVFEEELHGPSQEEMEEGSTLSKEESTDTSTLGGSIDEEEVVKK